MKIVRGAILGLTMTAAPLAACDYNETLERDQLVLVDDAALEQASAQAWEQALAQQTVSNDQALNDRVRRIGGELVRIAGLGHLDWQYVVFVSDQPNAFVVPGGRMGVTTALLETVESDDQLAAVLGHEAAHLTARHPQERYSQAALAQAGIQIAVGASGEDGEAIGALGGIGAALGVLLPFSRRHELEADRLGADYMHQAGYDPREAVALWRRLGQRSGAQLPEMVSTHPSDATRIEALEAYLAERGW